MSESPEMKLPPSDAERHLTELIESVDTRLAVMRPEIDRLMQARHELSDASDEYRLTKTMFDVARPTLERLYDEPTYNDVFVYGYDPRFNVVDDDPSAGGDLSARRGAKFHEGESYKEGGYVDAIFTAADRLGFVKKELGTASDPLDQEIGIADSDLAPVGRVEAVVVPGAAGMSNVLRVRDALRNIEQGRVETDTLIIATCDRPINDAENGRIKLERFQGGKTELEATIIALNGLAGTSIDPDTAEPYPVTLPGGEFEGKVVHQSITVAGRAIDCIIVSAPYDPERVSSWKDGEPQRATRANTDETFIAVNQLLPEGPGTILIESHDTWAIGQGVIAEQTFAIAGKDVIATGPRRLDRVSSRTDENGVSRFVLNQPEGIVDEIAKTYAYLTQTRIKAENAKAALGGQAKRAA